MSSPFPVAEKAVIARGLYVCILYSVHTEWFSSGVGSKKAGNKACQQKRITESTARGDEAHALTWMIALVPTPRRQKAK